MSISIKSSCHIGINALKVDVEVDISYGLPSFNIVGLGDTSIKESKERVRAAIINSDFEMPVGRITVNLAPADLKKEGSIFDLAIAIGILAASKQISKENLNDFLFLGELSLSGNINWVKGILPVIVNAKEENIVNIILPQDNLEESLLVKGINIYPFKTLKEITSFLTYNDLMPIQYTENSCKYIDYKDEVVIYGQQVGKRALVLSAAGRHNLMLYGNPGSGKTMLSKAIASILPPLTYEEALEVTKIYSVYGEKRTDLMFKAPFRSPHHTSTKISIIGGGSSLTPGEVSLAHKGVLFLDEILEFKREVLEVLRQPLEDKKVQINRIYGSVEYPCDCILVAACNPCICGNFGTEKCTCSDYDIKKYLRKLSGAFLDRMDIMLNVKNSSIDDMLKGEEKINLNEMRNKVVNIRNIQKERFKNEKISTNGEMNSAQIKKYCKLSKNSKNIIKKVFSTYDISIRGYNKILKVARTIADLEGNELIEDGDLIESINYRKFLDGKVI